MLQFKFIAVSIYRTYKQIKISEIIYYPVEASIGYPTPGSFGTYCGIEKNIPTITLELDEECSAQDLIEPVHKIFNLLENY